MTPAPIVFWQMQPCWGLPNASPFCMKLETWLRMAGLPYQAKVLERPPRSSTGKVPYLERPDGTLLADSSVIIETLTREHQVTLDAGLTEAQRALGLLIQRTLEEDLYFTVVADRWASDASFRITRAGYFGHTPWLVRTLFVPLVRRKVLAAARGQGTLRLPPERRHDKARAAIEALENILGSQRFFLGRASSVDATAYAFMANVIQAPIPSPVADAARARPRLLAYCQRMHETYYRDFPVVPGAAAAPVVTRPA